jgi:putative ABC transport system permease protein
MNERDDYRRLPHLTGRRQDVKGFPIEEDVDRELKAHLEQLVEDLVAEGWAPEAARAEARRRFGDPATFASPARRSARRRERRLRLGAVLDAWRIESRHTLRALVRRPGFSLAAVLILGVGIGAVVTIYSVFDTVLLRPLPYHEPGRLVQVMGSFGFSPVEFAELKDRTTTYSALAATWDWYAILNESGRPEQVRPLFVTEDFLAMFDARLKLGRFFEPEDFQNLGGVAILDHGWWMSRWAADPGIVGRTLTVNGRPVTVIGVLDPSFQPPEGLVNPDRELYLPLDVRHPALQERGFSVLDVVGRLDDGVSLGAAQREAGVLIERLAEENPGGRYRRSDGSLRSYRVVPLFVSTVRGVAPPILLLLGAVGFMLLIACADVANLLLARGVARSREVALRGALGASRRRVLLQFLSEGVLLALAGGLVGILLAHLGIGLFSRYRPGGVPRLAALALDGRVLSAAVVISLLTGLVSGLLPALRVARWNLSRLLQEASIGATEARQTQRLQSNLVVLEVALALVLTFGAVQTMRSLTALLRNDPGFQAADLYTVPVNLTPGFTAEHRNRMAGEVLDRIRAVPGVQAAGAGRSVPFEYSTQNGWMTTVRDAEKPDEPEAFSCIIHPVTAGYFEALGAVIAQGRAFTREDGVRDAQQAVINGNAAVRLFGTVEAVGRRIRIGTDRDFTVIGVSRGIQHWGSGRSPGFEVYIPDPPGGAFMERICYLVRSRAPLEELAPAIQQAVWSVDSEVPVDRFVPMANLVGEDMVRPRFLAVLFLTFAVAGLALAAGGIYATMLFWVGQRKREMGIRLAMGANGRKVIALTLGRALRLAGTGIVAGLLFAVLTSAALRSVVWGIQLIDPVTLLGVSLLIAAVTLVATLVPAWRAGRADPIEVLRAE